MKSFAVVICIATLVAPNNCHEDDLLFHFDFYINKQCGLEPNFTRYKAFQFRFNNQINLSTVAMEESSPGAKNYFTDTGSDATDTKDRVVQFIVA
jgi:hypothetical protein